MMGVQGPVMTDQGNLVPDFVKTNEENNKQLEARNIPSFRMPSVHGNDTKNPRTNKQGRTTRKTNNKEVANKDVPEEVVTPPTQKPKQLTLWDMKYLKKNYQETPTEEEEEMRVLFEKDPNDKSRECTIYEVFTMMMNIQETLYTELRNQEVRYQALLMAKDGKIEALNKLMKAI